MTATALIKALARNAKSAGGRIFIVGGAVRDKLLGLPVKDVDLELFGFSVQRAHRFLKNFGRVSVVGKSFGVFLLHHHDYTLEVALPRRDVKVARGHRGFKIIVDQNLTLVAAAQRRDFTVNATMFDPLANKIIDPFHGRNDLRRGILRAVDPKLLGDDPLRLQRAFQLCARFNLWPDAKTIIILRGLVRRRAELPGERKRMEWEKLMTAAHPSIGLRLAAATKYPASLFKINLVDRLAKIVAAQKITRDELLHIFFSAVFQKNVLTQKRSIKKWLADEGFSAISTSHLAALWRHSEKLTRPSKRLSRREIRLLAYSAWPLTLREVAVLAAARMKNPALVQSIRRAAAAYWTKRPTPLITGKMMRAKNWSPGKSFGLVQNAAEKAYARGARIEEIRRVVKRSVHPAAAIRALNKHHRS